MSIFFGGKGKVEKVGLDGLPALLNSLFEGKLGQFKARSSGIIGEIAGIKGQFISACDRFDLIDAEPDTEDLYFVNKNFIKSQKGVYAKALKRLMQGLALEPEIRTNSYDTARAVAGKAEEARKEILQANATFRLVVQCYSNYLGDFKKTFSSFEKSLAQLNAELDRKSTEASGYSTLNSLVEKLEALAAERETVLSNIAKLQASSSTADSADERAAIAARLSQKRAELEAEEKEASALRSSINALTSPLERPAKKFDHLSARKRPLQSFLSDPAGAIRSETDYAELRALVQELTKALEAGKIEVKNPSEISNAASALLNSGIYSSILRLDSLHGERTRIAGEALALEREIGKLDERARSSEMSAQEMGGLKKRIEEIGRHEGELKAKIEGAVLDNYGRSIELEIGP